MEISEKFGFFLPSRDSDDIADINQISENFRTIDKNVPNNNQIPLVVTEQNVTTSHTATEIYEACQAGRAVFLKINNRLIPIGFSDAYRAFFYDVQVGGAGARTTEYRVTGNLLVTSYDTYSPPVDTSLTQKSVAADAFTVGQKLGDVESALDNIIAIQNNLIGGGN